MDPQSSSPASSSMSRRNYDSFLSFRGADTRLNFISHLYHALCQKGIYTFKDSEELEAGQRRSELFDAIEGTRVAIVTFSENYARSKWCLDELHKIMECKGQGKLTVIPIFYHVSPREVRLHEKENGEKGCYQITMEEMGAKHDSDTVERWGKALWEGGDLIGVEVVSGQDEGDVVRDVVGRVMKIVNRVPLEVAKHPVGIDRHLTAIRPFLHIDPHVDDVCIVGLLGPGGAGKTTLSKAIYNDIANRFDNCCFLPNVRETARVFNGLAKLQRTLLRELLSEKGLKVSSVDKGKTLIKKRLGEKRVLVILDDVEESIQLHALAGDLNWFGSGSRIILTTRNERVLIENKVSKYEVNLLEREEAENLFRRHAFGTQDKVNIDCSLIDRFVDYAGKLPLALVVLGASLRDRSESEWEGKLTQLKESPDEVINAVLKISYDGLEKKHKEIFLDVACLFKGMDMDKVVEILDGCGFAASLGLTKLTERCLITIVDEGIQMHDLLVEMGRSISCDNVHGIPSRIWLYEDFFIILSDERSAQERLAVEGIVLDFHSKNDDECENDDERENDDPIIKFNALKDFKNLRILIINENVVCPEEPLQLPRELRWLEWRKCSASAIEFYQSCKLVYLHLQDSKIQQIKATGLEKLKHLHLVRCSSLKTLPDLSKCRDMEDLRLWNCNSLTRLEKIKATGLEKLKHLHLDGCSSLETLPDLSGCRDLEDLRLWNCNSLTRLEKIKATGLEKLKHLRLIGCSSLETLPDLSRCWDLEDLFLWKCGSLTRLDEAIGSLKKLVRLHLKECGKLSGFPRRAAGAATDVCGFPNLETLIITYCKLKDLEFLDDLTCFETLTSLVLSGNEFTHVPASMSKFKNLQELELHGCDRLVEVPEIPNVPYLNVAEMDEKKCFRADLSNSRSLDSGNINRLLSLENVRQSVGALSVIFPGEEFPHWVKFQSEAYSPFYRVFLPQEMLKDDPFGLALFISFDRVDPPAPTEPFRFCDVEVWFNGVLIIHHPCNGVAGVNSWCVYIPRQSLVQGKGDLASELNKLEIALETSDCPPVRFRRWGMRLLCKREEEDDLIKVLEDADDNDDPLEDGDDNDDPPGLGNQSFLKKLLLRLSVPEMNRTKRLKVR